MFCHACGEEIRTERAPGRQQQCPKCGRFLHCCRNCRFYDEAAYHQCREPQAEWVSDKESANFCDTFEAAKEKPGNASKADEARKKLDQLFGGGKKSEEGV